MFYDMLEAVWYNFEDFYGRFWVPDSLCLSIYVICPVCAYAVNIFGFFLYLFSPFIKYPVASNTLIFVLLLYMHIICVQMLQCTCISSPNVFWICILEPPALLYDCIMIMHKSHVFDSFPCMCPCTNLYICWNVFFNASHCKSIDALFTLYEFFKMSSHFLTQYCVCL